MDQFFIWLTSNPVAANLILGTLGLITATLVGIYLVAFFQGRSLSFWPPKIGEKPVSATPAKPKTKTAATPANPPAAPASGKIEVEWTNAAAPTPQSILAGAKSSILLLGTSHGRIMHSDIYLYRDWLHSEPRRQLGLLYLNPHSPHAFARERRAVQRSSRSSILQSLQAAYAEAQHNPQFLVGVYDGPYRYSARAINLGASPKARDATISLFTSSHKCGISSGFQINLSGTDTPPYLFYRQELLELWQAALANPPGHGLSLICRPGAPVDGEIPPEVWQPLCTRLGLEMRALHLFPPAQRHLTLSAICRTQTRPYAGPLTLGPAQADEDLPLHFGEFLGEILHRAVQLTQVLAPLTFNQLGLDPKGYLRLAMDSLPESAFSQAVNAFRADLSALLQTYAQKYPEEPWQAKIAQTEASRFGAKSDHFQPHISLGMAFNLATGLPTPLTGKNETVYLPTPLVCPLADLTLVQYAYRSLQRCTGELKITTAPPPPTEASEILAALGLNRRPPE